jgi:thiamine pyrophosphokinase
MNTCYIVCALDCTLDFKPDSTDYVVGADRGYLVLEKNKIKPDLVIGDFDSYTGEIQCESIVRFPVKKDYTDSELAIKHALEKGYKSIRIFGAIGGSLDHTIANLSLLVKYASKGIEIAFYDGENVVFSITNSGACFDENASGRISVFSACDKALGVFEKGLLYELDNAILQNTEPLGVSNEFVGVPSEISVQNGTLILYTSKKNYEKHLTKK